MLMQKDDNCTICQASATDVLTVMVSVFGRRLPVMVAVCGHCKADESTVAVYVEKLFMREEQIQ